jgi:hypothetical protein
MQVNGKLPIGQRYRDVVSHSLTANIGQFKQCNSLVLFFLWGANVFTLDSNEHYFRSRNRALPQDSYSLRGSARDLWTVALPSALFQWYSPGGTRRHLRGYVKLYIYILFHDKHWIIWVRFRVSHKRCRLYNMYKLHYVPTTLGVQSWSEIISGGTRTKKVEYHCSIPFRLSNKNRERISHFPCVLHDPPISTSFILFS